MPRKKKHQPPPPRKKFSPKPKPPPSQSSPSSQSSPFSQLDHPPPCPRCHSTNVKMQHSSTQYWHHLVWREDWVKPKSVVEKIVDVFACHCLHCSHQYLYQKLVKTFALQPGEQKYEVPSRP